MCARPEIAAVPNEHRLRQFRRVGVPPFAARPIAHCPNAHSTGTAIVEQNCPFRSKVSVGDNEIL